MAQALVVDDSRTMRKILTRTLGKLGFEASEASNGQEALDHLGSHTRPNLVLVDWNMPIMNGLDFIKAVRANHHYDDTVLVMVTSESEATQVEIALEAGANEYIMKPFTPDAIAEKIALATDR